VSAGARAVVIALSRAGILVVMGPHCHITTPITADEDESEIDVAGLCGTTEAVLRHAPCSVLIVR
jgi:nucleotide-binding universal stress UspA family protein